MSAQAISAQAILDKLATRGVKIHVVGAGLRVRPAGVLTDEERAEIRAHKLDLIALLGDGRQHRQPARTVMAYAFPWPDEIAGLGSRTVGPFACCSSCRAGSWVRYGETVVLCLACATRRDGAAVRA